MLLAEHRLDKLCFNSLQAFAELLTAMRSYTIKSMIIADLKASLYTTLFGP